MYDKQRVHLVQQLEHLGYIRSSAVKQAFLNVPREQFIPEAMRQHAYVDTPLQIGNGQTISAPHMVAIMCEALDILPGQKILEIGAGSGYHAAIVASIIQPNGHVYSTERITALVDMAQKNLKAADIVSVTVIKTDGSKGLPQYAPYDRIYITCAAPKLPDPMPPQLAKNGKILVPEGGRFCNLMLYEKQNSKLTSKNLGGCAFVPLIGKYGHQ